MLDAKVRQKPISAPASDKAAAMKAYALMRDDRTLHNLALRIQLRAERRCGELLKQIPRADETTRYGQVAAVPPVTRTQMAIDAGLSERQRKTALRIANVPAAAFEAQVESSRPPSITHLANLGKVTREPSGPGSPWEARSTAAMLTTEPWGEANFRRWPGANSQFETVWSFVSDYWEANTLPAHESAARLVFQWISLMFGPPPITVERNSQSSTMTGNQHFVPIEVSHGV